jgi:hypothetical protein
MNLPPFPTDFQFREIFLYAFNQGNILSPGARKQYRNEQNMPNGVSSEISFGCMIHNQLRIFVKVIKNSRLNQNATFFEAFEMNPEQHTAFVTCDLDTKPTYMLKKLAFARFCSEVLRMIETKLQASGAPIQPFNIPDEYEGRESRGANSVDDYQAPSEGPSSPRGEEGQVRNDDFDMNDARQDPIDYGDVQMGNTDEPHDLPRSPRGPVVHPSHPKGLGPIGAILRLVNIVCKQAQI